jgi:hypothetical protein
MNIDEILSNLSALSPDQLKRLRDASANTLKHTTKSKQDEDAALKITQCNPNVPREVLIGMANELLTLCGPYSDLSELVRLSRVIANNVLNDQLSQGVDDSVNLVKRDDLILAHMFGETVPGFTLSGKEGVEKQVLPLAVKFVKFYVSALGFFYPFNKEGDLETVLKKVKEASDKCPGQLSHGTVGSFWLRDVFKSYWHVSNGPRDISLLSKPLEKVILYRLGLGKSRPYKYTLSDGREVECTETFDLNFNTIRTGFIVNRHCVSFFKPAMAASVYEMFLKGIDKPVVWDPSCGFGARLLGFAAVKPNGTYKGNEPASETYRDLMTAASQLVTLRPGLKVFSSQKGSEIKTQGKDDGAETVDFVFTSPPYFDTEKYFDEPGQCWRDYSTLDEWTKEYLIGTFENAFKVLESGKFMVINISNKYVELFIKAALSVGFLRREDLDVKLTLSSDHFSRSSGHTDKKHEPFLAFQKPAKI